MSTTNVKQLYMERMIRKGYSSADVTMWQSLLRSCEIDEPLAISHLSALLDLASHLKCSHLDLIKTGRELAPKEKRVTEAFLKAIFLMVDEDEFADHVDANKSVNVKTRPGGNGDSGTVNKPALPKVLDLTADDDDESSASYEETSEPGSDHWTYNQNPTSAEAYEIDGFVVPDEEATPPVMRRSLKRRQEISCEE